MVFLVSFRVVTVGAPGHQFGARKKATVIAVSPPDRHRAGNTENHRETTVISNAIISISLEYQGTVVDGGKPQTLNLRIWGSGVRISPGAPVFVDIRVIHTAFTRDKITNIRSGWSALHKSHHLSVFITRLVEVTGA